MPTPVAHSLAGLALYQIRPDRRQQLLLLGLLVVAANLPDLDFIPGMMRGNADLYHHGPSHSLLVGAALGMLAGWLTALRWGTTVGRQVGFAIAAGYASHVFLDMLCIDTRPPFGVPAFWPLWGGYVASPVELFFDIHRDRDTADFFASLWQPHNLRAAAWELLLMSFVVTLTGWVARRRRRAPVFDGVPDREPEI